MIASKILRTPTREKQKKKQRIQVHRTKRERLFTSEDLAGMNSLLAKAIAIIYGN